MKIIQNIHPDWEKAVYPYISREEFINFLHNILPETSYYPKSKEIFESFKMPLKDIRVVIIDTEPTVLKENNYIPEGVFILNNSLTSEVGNLGTHKKYWADLVAGIVRYISLNHPCIWIINDKENVWLLPNIINSVFRVINYDEETIQQIPINPDFNYILYKEKEAEEYANVILKKQKLKEIKW